MIKMPRAKRSGERGLTLVEPLIAVAILSIALVGFLGAFATGSMSIGRTDRNVTAQHLARSQMEQAKSLAYQAPPVSYQTISAVPNGYVVTADGASLPGKDGDIQKITVTVSFEGRQVFVLEGLKTNR